MAITDMLVGRGGLERQRDKAIDYAEEMYDPSVFQPQADLARERATEGISEGQESLARQRTVESLFRPQDLSIYGGNQARAIAGEQARNQQAQEGMSRFEQSLTQQDIQARQAGEQQLAQTQTQQRQVQSRQDAAIEEAELQFETELQRRKQQLGSAVGQIAGTLAGTALGPLGATAVGAGVGGLLGGGGGATSGGLSGLTTAMGRQEREDLIAMLTGRAGQAQGSGGAGQAPTVAADVPEDKIMWDFPTGEDLAMEFMAGEEAMNRSFAGEQTPSGPQAPPRPNVPAQRPIDQILSESIDTSGVDIFGEPINPPTTEFSATGQYLGQGNLGGMGVNELLQSIFGTRNQEDITRTFSPLR